MNRRARRRLAISIAIALGVSSLLSALYLGDRFAQFNRQLSDVFFLTKAQQPQQSRFITLVGLDDKSVVELRSQGRVFNWPRSLYAKVIDNLVEARARAIAFDILFDTPSAGDDELIAALGRARERAVSVVMPSAGDPLTRREVGRNLPETFADAFEPYDAIKDASAGVGMVNQLPDTDGTVRRMPLIYTVGDQPYPSLPLLAVAKFLRRPQAWDQPPESGNIALAGRNIPVDGKGTIIVNYAGGPHKSAPPAFPVVSFSDVANGTFNKELVDRKLVYIGLTATGFADDYWTPPSLAGKMDGVEIHANVSDTILRAEFLRDAPPWVTITMIVGFGMVAALALMLLPPLVAALICAVVLVALFVGASAVFDGGGMTLNLIYPPVSVLLTYAGIVLYRVIVEQHQSRMLRGVLGQYLSPSVVAEVTRDPESLKLGGDQREMTVLFSDLRGFTTISEQLDPESLVALLTEYLTAMSDVIFRHEGTIDKYMGDAVMAFWGAPQHQPAHARHALNAALDMIDELQKLQAKWTIEGRTSVHMGIGINTGQMKVGNMGSATRFDYTVIGDSVNLGARLESLNKEYGTTLIVSGTTLAEAGAGFHSRFLDLVAVKGKSEPVEVFQIMTPREFATPGVSEAIGAYAAGMQAYLERDWLGAAARFQEALRHCPSDGPSALYLERCELLMDTPPPADWNGVFVMTHK